MATLVPWVLTLISILQASISDKKCKTGLRIENGTVSKTGLRIENGSPYRKRVSVSKNGSPSNMVMIQRNRQAFFLKNC
jgi:hypothetical protein